MSNEAQLEELLNFFKALADANRLKIIALLSQQELTPVQLAEMLDVRPPTITHHLAKLTRVGLVSARVESYYNVYHLETSVLEEMSRRLLANGTMSAMVSDVDFDSYDRETLYERKVVKSFSNPDGTLEAIPLKGKKLLAVLRYVIQDFKPGVHYSKKQVREMLACYHEDYAQLRRELVGCGFLTREGGGGKYLLTKSGIEVVSNS